MKLPTISNWAKSTSKRPPPFSRKIKVDILENEIAYFDQNSMLIPNTYGLIATLLYRSEKKMDEKKFSILEIVSSTS